MSRNRPLMPKFLVRPAEQLRVMVASDISRALADGPQSGGAGSRALGAAVIALVAQRDALRRDMLARVAEASRILLYSARTRLHAAARGCSFAPSPRRQWAARRSAAPRPSAWADRSTACSTAAWWRMRSRPCSSACNAAPRTRQRSSSPARAAGSCCACRWHRFKRVGRCVAPLFCRIRAAVGKEKGRLKSLSTNLRTPHRHLAPARA